MLPPFFGKMLNGDVHMITRNKLRISYQYVTITQVGVCKFLNIVSLLLLHCRVMYFHLNAESGICNPECGPQIWNTKTRLLILRMITEKIHLNINMQLVSDNFSVSFDIM